MRCTARQTDEGAELHQGLVEVSCIFGQARDQCFLDSALCTLFQDVGRAGEEAHDDAQHVAVDGGTALAEGDGGDGTCCVAAYAGQSEQAVEVRGNLAAMVAADETRGRLQMARAAVVAETFP